MSCVSSDLTNQRFGRLVARAPVDRRSKHGNVVWLCDCDCGRLGVLVNGSHLVKRVRPTSSCGCIRAEDCRTKNPYGRKGKPCVPEPK